MRIVHVIPGNGGGFYCENCLRDAAIVRTLRALGHDALVAPMYLPLPEPDFGRTDRRVFCGAVGLYLAESVPFLRGMPRWLERIVDSRPALALASRMSGSTDPSSLSELTLSMLAGEGDFYARELDGLARWIAREAKPDIVHLSNALILAIAGRIRSETRIPVVVSLQDEDTWIDELDPEDAERAWSLVGRQAANADLFMPVSDFYARSLAAKLGIDLERMRVVPIGIDVERYRTSVRADPPRIGYLSRLSERMGFGILAEAFALLKKMPGTEQATLAAMGGSTGSDRAFLKKTFAFLSSRGILKDVSVHRGFAPEERIDFLSSLAALSVPASSGEAFGAFLIEAAASGVPAVQPRVGAYTEILSATGGGVLTQSAAPREIADALSALLRDPGRAAAMAARGRAGVQAGYTTRTMAEGALQVFERALRKRRTA